MSELPDMAQALMNPGIYPDNPTKVDLIQTQTSFIFLTGDYAYKVKKPVDLGYLDYTTLDKRRFYCQREIELNRRLCPDIYLGMVPITEDKDGYSIDGKGKVVEYAVKMLHLPRESMLNVLLKEGKVSEEMIKGVAGKIAEFHRKAATSNTISDYGDLEVIITNTEENFIQTIRYISNTISQRSYRHIKDYINGFIEDNTTLFYERIADGKIKDCHGDIQSTHICFDDDIYIYDCVEYNDRLRYCDVASDIALLAMDLDSYDRADLSRILVEAYVAFTGDDDLLQLLDFYKCYRAYERGRMESIKLDDPEITEEDKKAAQAAAARYFELAESYAGDNPDAELNTA